MKFTYSEEEVRKITKFFQDTRIKTAFRIQNKIQNILIPPFKQINIAAAEFVKSNA
jgi:hypothetical protein